MRAKQGDARNSSYESMISVFVLLFVVLYGLLHLLLYLRLTSAWSISGALRATLITWMAGMVLAPFFVRLLEHQHFMRTSWWVSLVSYTWMVWMVWFGAWTLFWVCLSAILWPLRSSYIAAMLLSTRFQTVFTFSAIVACSLWGVWEANRIRVNHVVIQSPGIPAGAPTTRIVQISDMHLGRPRGVRFAKLIADKVRALQPDLLVSTGDFVDGAGSLAEATASVFRELHVPLGKFAVLGNHEFYRGVLSSELFHEAAGFVLLRGRAVEVQPWLVLVGVDDPAAHYTRQTGFTDERQALESVPSTSRVVILLKHQPRVSQAVAHKVDLQLSGHTHGGQFFPFGLLVRLMYPYGSGMHRISNRMLLYVSRGTGTWGTPIRFLARPEITVFVLTPAANAAR